jgi:flagellar motor switch protein FliG
MAIQMQNRTSAAKGMPGSDRVAAILLTMGKSLSARLMKHFEADEIRQITRSASELRPVSAPQLGSLIEDFATQFALGASLVSSPAEVQRMLDGVLPKEQIDEIMGEVAGKPDNSTWDRISAVNEGALAAYILSEHPQTAALILSKIKSATAAKIIALLPADKRDGLIRRMLSVKPVADEAMRLFERILQSEFSGKLARLAGGQGNAHIADIINKLDSDQVEAILQSLATTRPKTAEALKSQLFTFEDLAKLSQRARGTLFDMVPADKVALALKGTSAEYREVILSSLSSRVRKMIEQELNNGQAVPARDVIEARRSIVDLALEHAGRGDIEIRNQEEELIS